MNYSELIELGFKRTDAFDEVHLRRYGFPAFFLTYDISKRHQLYWTVLERDQVTLYKCKSDGCSVQDIWLIKDIQVVADLIRMFG
jgi:hypothetical protein